MRRPKYACRSCPGAVIQAPAPPRLIEGGLPTGALVAYVIIGKYADHLPLYRQAQIYARQGIELDRSTLADWAGRAAWSLRPLHERLLEHVRASTKLFANETTAPVLDPGRGRTKTGQLWAYARDDRPWGGTAPPAVAYVYPPGYPQHIILISEQRCLNAPADPIGSTCRASEVPAACAALGVSNRGRRLGAEGLGHKSASAPADKISLSLNLL
jgi:hypothetical protein